MGRLWRLDVAAFAVAALLAAPVGSSAAGPQDFANQLSANDTALRQAIDSWRAPADPPATRAPDTVFVPARAFQTATSFLAAHANLARSTTPLLPQPLSDETGQLTVAARDLLKLSRHSKHHKLRVGTPRPLSELRAYYDEAERRYGVDWSYLAAIHFVETKFGQVKSDSAAGAKGPMQFIPSTWRIYGNGGDIHDPHDAILAAANFLRANGAPGNYTRALRAYNQSGLYVDAVRRYAGVLGRDPYALYFLYCWLP